MRNYRDWFWQLEASGLGPDHFIVVRFLPSQAETLLRVACQFMPIGFVAESVSEGRRRFIDQRTFEGLKSMLEVGATSNIYISSSIDVRDGILTIENTYARHEDGETAFLMAVLQSSDLSLQHWRVFAGGSGYDSIEVARGEGAALFVEYLTPEIL